jgi:biopolymer transport protein ExbB
MAELSANEKVWEFLLSGGIFMAFIAICSFVAIAVSIHRALTLRWKSIIPFDEGQAPEVLAALQRDNSPVARVGRIALSAEFSNREEATEATEATAKEQMVKLENGMGVLEVVITIAPLLGLLGTVSGLVGVFATLGEAGDVSDPTRIAAGIAVALNTTIAGLVVAVITVILHSYFTRRLERIAARIEVIAGHLLHEFYKRGGSKLYPEPGTEPEPKPDAALAEAIEQGGQEVEPSDFLS